MTAPPPRQQVTRILLAWNEGDPNAVERLTPLVYDELRQLARSYLQRERAGHTLQATGLVHEAYLRLVDETTTNWENRAHFLAIAARQMRRILVEHARRHNAQKRGGDWDRVELDEALIGAAPRRLDLVALDDALQDLARLNPRHSQIVELRFFGGLTFEEAGKVLDVSARTVERDWRMARVWLRRAVFPEELQDVD